MRFRRNVGQGYGKFWRGVIFDREYKNLDDLVSKSMRWFPMFEDGARFLSAKSDFKWSWPTGEELLFRAVSNPKDYWAYHGQEFPWIGWNELTKYPDDQLLESLSSCNRSSFRPEDYPLTIDGDIFNATGEIVIVGQEGCRTPISYLLPEMPLEMFMTTNPYGVGHNWVKKKFIRPAAMGQIYRTTVNVFNPRTQQREDVVKTQVHLFGSYRENKYLAPEYIATLEQITEPNKRDAWLRGSWDIVAGGMFDDLWNKSIHIVKPFRIPSSWRIDRAFDYGSSKPFSVGWWAESDGSDYADGEGKLSSTVRGDLFRIGEWYGSTGKPNEGLRMLAGSISEGIVARELRMAIHDRVLPGAADNSIWDVMDGNSIANGMAKSVRLNGKNYRGVQWMRSDKSPGSRKAGWKRIREYLDASLPQFEKLLGGGVPRQVPRHSPGVFIFETCTDFIDLVPVLPRDEKDPDDVDTNAEDHIGDEFRYRVLSSLRGGKGGQTTGT